ncbi:MAG: NUDIX hydrolase [Marvinbryantia sp.]
MKLTTLCYIENNTSYLMLHRISKKTDANKDKWIGVGGHFGQNESPEDCLLREVKEETGLCLTSWRQRGIVTFVSDLWETEYMFLYTADGYTGELKLCEEGVLEWIPKADLSKLQLWQGDLIFFELLEAQEPFFSLKLIYEGETLVEAFLNGSQMKL